MSVAYMSIICGYPITEQIICKANELFKDEAEKDPWTGKYVVPNRVLTSFLERVGFEVMYSAIEPVPVGFIGVELKRFAEGEIEKFSDANLKPTPEQLDSVKEKVSKLPLELRSVMEEIDIWVIWSTS